MAILPLAQILTMRSFVRYLSEPWHRVLGGWPGLLKFPQQLADGRVVLGRLQNKIGKILRDKEIVSQSLLDRFRDL